MYILEHLASFRLAKVDSFWLPEGRGQRPNHKEIPNVKSEIAENGIRYSFTLIISAPSLASFFSIPSYPRSRW